MRQMLNRRSLITGLISLAPAIVRASSLMPVRSFALQVRITTTSRSEY
jgi:hypothetical protein